MRQDQAWIVAVDMGYGHQRAAFPLRKFSPTGKVINANNYQGIPAKDYRLWNSSQKIYESISRLKNVPLIGERIFNLMDYFQRIPSFYPRRNLSAPSLQLKTIYRSIRRGWGKDLVNFLNKQDIPLISTFFTISYMAEEHNFKNDIYQVICDSDVSRAWAPLNPKKSRIKYFVPNQRVVERLKLYGVKEESIFLTGFPLPQENIGENFEILKQDIAERVINLDPEHRYRDKHAGTMLRYLKGVALKARHHHPLTLTFAVGGAGAQKNIGHDIVYSLRKKIIAGEINLNLVAGSRNDVYNYFKECVVHCGIGESLGANVQILYDTNKTDYFIDLDKTLRTTDILWTKPSELVFYCALGLPIIMAPSVGSQEEFNRTWLKTIGAGISQNDPRYTDEWLFDWINSGWLAEAAMSGFLDGRQFGVRNIEEVVFKGVRELNQSLQLV